MKEKIADFQKEVKDSTQKVWLAGLGALSMAGEEGQKLFKNLVEKGEEFQKREKPPVEAVKRTVDSAREKAEDLWKKLESGFNGRVAAALQKLGVPSRDEIGELTKRVDALMEAIQKLSVQGKKKASAK